MEWVAAAMAVVGGISSIIGGNKAKHASKRASREEARLEGIVTGQKIRELFAEERQLHGDTIGAAAGSGVDVGFGSVLDVLSEQASTFERTRDVTRQVGASKASVALQRGSMIGNLYQSQGISSAFQSFGQALGYIG